jgi:signal transduction histidine kinase
LLSESAVRRGKVALVLIVLAYGLSSSAGIWHLVQALTRRLAPAHGAMLTLTLGYGALTLALLLLVRGQTRTRRAVWVLALAVFAVSALHLSHHQGGEFPWWVELIGHHASLPLALVILYQDYRFALADLFFKRALVLVLLVTIAFGLYQSIAAPLLQRALSAGELAPLTVGLLLGLWVTTALAFQPLWRVVSWFVDVFVLRRVDYEALRVELAQRLAVCEKPEQILDEVCTQIGNALTANGVSWMVAQTGNDESDASAGPLSELMLPLISQTPKRRTHLFPRARVANYQDAMQHGATWRNSPHIIASVLVPVTETSPYCLLIGELQGGRRLLSDDLALLEAVALLAARRIDSVRVTHERCVRDLHEEEMRKLATVAELRALRAQINPHFLFNALTTIGYLIQTTPERALQTLLKLTALLRGVLRSGDGEFCTLGDELSLVEAYLEIEQARFEERLRVLIDVPATLRQHRIPALLIQPLVENAIKHGISPCKNGGEVVILARRGKHPTRGHEVLQIWVRDTGAGANDEALAQGRSQGVGLVNVAQRIERHYVTRGEFSILSAPGVGTTVEITVPLEAAVSVTESEFSQLSERQMPPPSPNLLNDYALAAGQRRHG